MISENNNRCTVNDFIFACYVICFCFIIIIIIIIIISSKSSNSNFWCNYLYRIHNICKYFEFVRVHIQK